MADRIVTDPKGVQYRARLVPSADGCRYVVCVDRNVDGAVADTWRPFIPNTLAWAPSFDFRIHAMAAAHDILDALSDPVSEGEIVQERS